MFFRFQILFEASLERIVCYNLNDPQAAAAAGIPMYQRRQRQLQTAIDNTLQVSVTREIVASNYQHADTYLPACIQLQDIWH